MAEKTSPLLTLINRFRSLGPPSLSAIIGKFGDIEDYQQFLMLIRDYLPEYETEILVEPPEAGQIAKFASRFEDRYFPLSYHLVDFMFNETRYSNLTRSIPIEVRGFTWEDYDQISSDARPGFQLMVYLLENPYGNGDNERVSLAEACIEHVGQELLERVPEGGIGNARANELFNSTRYKPIAMLCDWLFQSTGNFFLDTDIEFMSYNMGEPEWDKETVETLTRQWQAAELFDTAVSEFAEWLEVDLKAHFQEILDFIAERG